MLHEYGMTGVQTLKRESDIRASKSQRQKMASTKDDRRASRAPIAFHYGAVGLAKGSRNTAYRHSFRWNRATSREPR